MIELSAQELLAELGLEDHSVYWNSAHSRYQVKALGVRGVGQTPREAVIDLIFQFADSPFAGQRILDLAAGLR